MKYIDYTNELELNAALRRPQHDVALLTAQVAEVMQQVKEGGDLAVIRYTSLFDKVDLTNLKVSESEMESADGQVDDVLKEALALAKRNIKIFHTAQKTEVERIETQPGVVCWRESRAIQNVGLYVPGGTAPLLSTVLMLAVPASVAGCSNVVLCSPPDKSGNIHPAILYAASLCGVTSVYKAGGGQAIAAMTYGTESIPKVDKIFGPGNQYVTRAKVLAQQEGVAIDMPAGPSEVLIWADDAANPEYVAADLLAQAEHGIDSQVILVCDSKEFGQQVELAVTKQMATLPRKDIIEVVLEKSSIVVVEGNAAISIINQYAPEHLIIQRGIGQYRLEDIVNAGSVFIGEYTPESAGDYASGTNHTLPTNGYATAYSGVSLDSYVKKITFQEITKSGLEGLEKIISPMAATEQLEAHKRAVLIRLNK